MAWRRSARATSACTGEIFALQDEAALGCRRRLIASLRDPLLLGHVLWQRYMHPTAYRSTYEELHGWLEHYADHPGADRVYRLALRAARPARAAPPRPVRGYLGGAGQERQERDAGRLPQRTGALGRRGRGGAARGATRSSRLVGSRPAGSRRARSCSAGDPRRWSTRSRSTSHGGAVAARLARRRRRPAEALALARRAAARCGDVVPEIHWTAGLSAWRIGQIRSRRRGTSRPSPRPRPRIRPPSARARRSGRRAPSWSTCKPAAGQPLPAAWRPRTQDFYGLLARAVLGDEPLTTGADPSALRERPGRGAAALSRRAARAGARPDRRERRWPSRRSASSPDARQPELMPGLIALADVARSAGGADAPRPEPAPPRRRRPSFRRALSGAELAAGRRLHRSTGRWCTPSCAPNRAFDPDGREPCRRARPDAGHAGDRAVHRGAQRARARRTGTACSSPRPASARPGLSRRTSCSCPRSATI